MANVGRSRQAVPDRVHRTRLDNGLTVLIQEVGAAPLVSVWCWYRVGSKDEVAGMTGASHWVEHMNFKGTHNIPADQMTGLIERYGGGWNGYTWIDQTAYLETATTDALESMLRVEAERMSGCVYDPADCESERTVIISELHGAENDPEQLLETEVVATAFKAHPYRHPTIGWFEDLQRMDRDDLYGHYRRYYLPNNATLVIVGDVGSRDALRLVTKHFAPLAAGEPPPRSRVVEPPQRGERRVTVEREGTTAYLKLGYHAPAVDDPDYFPMLVLDAILTGPKGLNLWSSFREPPPQRRARLYRALVDGGLASSIGGALLPTTDPFLYLLSATVTDGVTVGVVEQVTTDQIEQVRRQSVTSEEITRAKRQLYARLVLEADSVTNLAHQLGYFETVASLDIHRCAHDRIDAVSLGDVTRVAGRYLMPANRTVGTFVPVGHRA